MGRLHGSFDGDRGTGPGVDAQTGRTAVVDNLIAGADAEP